MDIVGGKANHSAFLHWLRVFVRSLREMEQTNRRLARHVVKRGIIHNAYRPHACILNFLTPPPLTFNFFEGLAG